MLSVATMEFPIDTAIPSELVCKVTDALTLYCALEFLTSMPNACFDRQFKVILVSVLRKLLSVPCWPSRLRRLSSESFLLQERVMVPKI